MKIICSIILPLFLTMGVLSAVTEYNFENTQSNIFTFNGSFLEINRQNAEPNIQNNPNLPPGFCCWALSTFGAANNNSPYVLNFQKRVVRKFSVDVGDFGGDTDAVTIIAFSGYAATGDIIDSDTSVLVPNGSNFSSVNLSVSGSNIRSVVMQGGSDTEPNSVYYDNLKVVNAPDGTSFNNDVNGFSDLTVYRDGEWRSRLFTGESRTVQFGLPDDIPVPGDYDGDGQSDYTVFRDGIWYTQLGTGEVFARQFGIANDIPITADFDNDGISDIGVYREGIWYWANSSDGSVGIQQFGIAGDIPVPGYWDNDGKADIGVFRPSTGNWYSLGSRDGSFKVTRFGLSTDIPVPADYDNDGITDIAIFRDGQWWILRSLGSLQIFNVGEPGDIPVTSVIPIGVSYAHMPKIAVFRPSDGHWYIRDAGSHNTIYNRDWGMAGDMPISYVTYNHTN